VKWAGTAFSALLLAALIASRWKGAELWLPGNHVVGVVSGVLRGEMHVPFQSTDHAAGFVTIPPSSNLLWKFRLDRHGTHESIDIPLWVFLLPMLLATIVAWRLDTIARRRILAGECANCGYDLSATPAGAKCPECGTVRAKNSPRSG